MKVKTLLKFYFMPERAEERLNRLICRKAFAAYSARGALRCAEEVAELVRKKGELCSLWGFLDGAARRCADGELETLKVYALSGQRGAGAEGRRLAAAFARRVRGGSARHGEGLGLMSELDF